MPGAAAADDYAHATWLFLRVLGLVYLVAFASLAVQWRGLLGEGGILPAGRLLAQVRRSHGRRALLALPTLCWWRSDDRFLGLLCGAGIGLSLLLTAGAAQVPALVGLYVLYLSLVSASGVFLGYQWDVLLLEAGFLAISAAPLDLGLAWPPGPAAHPLVRWLLYWLLFRLIASSGVVKLRSGDRAWRTLTALGYHYESHLSLERLRSLLGLGRLRGPGLRGPARGLTRALDPFRLVNGYGLFAVMTTSRPELRVEGSLEGEEWRPYRFRWKAGDPGRAPRWAMPHQPRLDWQLWFEALRGGRPSGWFPLFLEALLEARPAVLGLLAEDPFGGERPRQVRAELDDYRFTDPGTRRETGRWWTRRRLGTHHPAVGLREEVR